MLLKRAPGSNQRDVHFWTVLWKSIVYIIKHLNLPNYSIFWIVHGRICKTHISRLWMNYYITQKCLTLCNYLTIHAIDNQLLHSIPQFNCQLKASEYCSRGLKGHISFQPVEIYLTIIVMYGLPIGRIVLAQHMLMFASVCVWIIIKKWFHNTKKRLINILMNTLNATLMNTINTSKLA